MKGGRIGKHCLQRFCRHQHTRYASTWVGAGTHHEQVLNVFAEVMRPEPGALQQQRLKPKGRALVRQQIVLKVLRGRHE